MGKRRPRTSPRSARGKYSPCCTLLTRSSPRTYSTAQIAAIEKTRQASGGGGAILPVVSYKDHEEKDKLGVSGLVSGRPERVPSSRGRADNTVTSMSLTDGYGSDSSMESLDEKPKLDKGKGKAKLPSVCLSVSSREEV